MGNKINIDYCEFSSDLARPLFNNDTEACLNQIGLVVATVSLQNTAPPTFINFMGVWFKDLIYITLNLENMVEQMIFGI